MDYDIHLHRVTFKLSELNIGHKRQIIEHKWAINGYNIPAAS